MAAGNLEEKKVCSVGEARMGATASLKRARPSKESESSAQMTVDGAQVVSVVRRQSTRRQVIHASATQYRALQRLRDD